MSSPLRAIIDACPTRPDTLVLDVDGTLMDTNYLHTMAWMRAFAAEGLHPPTARVHRAIGMGGDKLVAEVCGEGVERDRGDALREGWVAEYQKLLPDAVPLDGAPDVLRAARDEGLRVALASSGESQFTEASLEALGWDEDDLDAVTSGDDADESKPAPDILEVALRKAGGTVGLMVGDSPWDVKAARKAGMECVVVRTGGFGDEELEAEHPVRILDGVRDLVGDGGG